MGVDERKAVEVVGAGTTADAHWRESDAMLAYLIERTNTLEPTRPTRGQRQSLNRSSP